jgi:hypothetical protein
MKRTLRTDGCGLAIFSFGRRHAETEPAELSWRLSLDVPSNSAVTPFIGSFGD